MKNLSGFPRVKVGDVWTGKFPEQENATLLAGSLEFAKVILDGEEDARSYAWAWIKFTPTIDKVKAKLGIT